jgi:hypothetical protein
MNRLGGIAKLVPGWVLGITVMGNLKLKIRLWTCLECGRWSLSHLCIANDAAPNEDRKKADSRVIEAWTVMKW